MFSVSFSDDGIEEYNYDDYLDGNRLSFYDNIYSIHISNFSFNNVGSKIPL